MKKSQSRTGTFIVSALLIMLLPLFMMTGCGKTDSDKYTDNGISVSSPKEGDEFTTNKSIVVEFEGPTDKNYTMSYFFIPVGDTFVASGMDSYDEVIGGYLESEEWTENPVPNRHTTVSFSHGILPGNYRIMVVFQMYDIEALNPDKGPILHYGYSGVFTIE